MFRRPSQGQSLISYLSEQDFGSCADLEKVGAAGVVVSGVGPGPPVLPLVSSWKGQPV